MNEPTAAAALSEYDFIIAIDKSGSMGETDMPGGRSRWEAVQESAISIAREVGKIDSDGLGLVLFSGTGVTSHDGVSVDKIKEVFAQNRPAGSTPLAEALEASFKLAGKSDKKDFIIVFTDGVPDNQEAAANVIRNQANSQETDDACTVLFVQVGYDAHATKYLQNLDDNLAGAKFDIVDAKTMQDVDSFPSITDLIVHAIND